MSKPLIIQRLKRYRMRGGGLVQILKLVKGVSADYWQGEDVYNGRTLTFELDGRHSPIPGREHDFDIIRRER